MKLSSAPLRFVVGVLGLWVGARAVMLTLPASSPTPMAPQRPMANAGAPPLAPIARSARAMPMPRPFLMMAPSPGPAPVPRLLAAMLALPAPAPERLAEDAPMKAVAGQGPSGWSLVTAAAMDEAPPATRLPLPSPVSTADTRRWSGTAYIFLRQEGDTPALASGGQLGGSQLFARVAYQLPGPVAIAARVYSPIETADGAEAAVGADLHLLRGKAVLRLSAERRIALGDQARDAWSAYAAGGFYTALPLGLEADGYGQAGVVGARRRDLFADGALRVTHPVPLGDAIRAGIGVGAWGAAQPGVERLDIGPRASLSLPVAGRSIAVNLDMRLRVAGEARPGSGVALTIGGDF